jgi:hypothetical protein
MAKRPTGPLTPKDIPILKFIWWWKIASTAAITARFEMDYGWIPETVHWRLNRMKKRGYVAIQYVPASRGGVWTLTALGFKAIEPSLPKLRESGFATENVTHDLRVQAAHLGEWLPRGTTPDIRIFTEQELRRIDPSCYPEWVPTSALHRPDGYWNLPSATGRRVVALEVELSTKAFDDYRTIANFYAQEPAITSVLWYVASESLAAKIEKAATECPFGYRRIHQYIKLSDLESRGWGAQIFSGSCAGQNASAFLNQHRSLQAPCPPLAIPLHARTRSILDTTLFRVKSASSEISETSESPD